MSGKVNNRLVVYEFQISIKYHPYHGEWSDGKHGFYIRYSTAKEIFTQMFSSLHEIIAGKCTFSVHRNALHSEEFMMDIKGYKHWNHIHQL